MRFYKVLTVALLLFAAWLFWRQPLAVPPGLEMDELIEGQIAAHILQGEWRIFYEDGQGREGLYYYWLALWLRLLGVNPFALRLASTTITLLGLSGMTALLRRLFGAPVALLALAYAGTSFWLIFAARSGLRSTALLLIAALAALFFWQGLRRRRGRDWLLAGFLVGISFYAYTAARVLPIAFALFLLYLLLWRRDWLRGQARHITLMGGTALLTALPLILYLQANPELDQLDFHEFDRPLTALRAGDPWPALQTGWQTLGMFFYKGDPLIFDNVPHRPIFNRINGLLFAAGLFFAVRRALLPAHCRPAHAFALIWLLTGLLPGVLSAPAPNFYRTVLAQLTTFVFPALALWGLYSVFSRQFSVFSRHSLAGSNYQLLPAGRWLRATVYYSLLVLLVGGQLVDNWRAYFDEWPQVEGVSFFWQTELTAVAGYLTHLPADPPVTLCTSLTYEYDDWWRPAWQSMVYLMPRQMPIRYYDCRITHVLPAERPFLSLYLDDIQPHEWWLPPAGDPLPELTRGWRVMETALPITSSLTARLGPEAGETAVSLPVQFGDSLRLTGYAYEENEDGRLPTVITAWEVIQTPPPRLALFTHIMTDPWTVVAQQDGLPLTSHSLQPGDRFWLRHNQIWRPAGLDAGEPLVAIGLYSQDSGERLPLQPGGDRLFLQEFTDQ